MMYVCVHPALHADGRTKLVTFESGSTLEVDTVMYCIGRTPNVDSLNLSAVGIAQAADGAIQVDAYSRTSVPHIFAIGDVTNRLQLTPVAIHEGQCFADTAFGGDGATAVPARAPDYVNVPSAGIVSSTLRCSFFNSDISDRMNTCVNTMMCVRVCVLGERLFVSACMYVLSLTCVLHASVLFELCRAS